MIELTSLTNVAFNFVIYNYVMLLQIMGLKNDSVYMQETCASGYYENGSFCKQRYDLITICSCNYKSHTHSLDTLVADAGNRGKLLSRAQCTLQMKTTTSVLFLFTSLTFRYLRVAVHPIVSPLKPDLQCPLLYTGIRNTSWYGRRRVSVRGASERCDRSRRSGRCFDWKHQRDVLDGCREGRVSE
jgi:hypothetical protein